jgi:hypothetical protein
MLDSEQTQKSPNLDQIHTGIIREGHCAYGKIGRRGVSYTEVIVEV